MGYLADGWKRGVEKRAHDAEVREEERAADQAALDAALKFREGGQVFSVYEDIVTDGATKTRRVGMSISPQGIEVGMVLGEVPGTFALEYLPGTLVPWDEVSEVLIDGPDELSKRVTAGRALAFGVLALAMQKSDSRVYIVIETTGGDTQMFYSKDASAPDVRTWFRPYQGKFAKSPQSASTIVDAPARMKALQTMLDDGLITQEEFDGKRQAILDAL